MNQLVTEFTGKTLENFETPNPALVKTKKTVQKYVDNIAENIKAGNGLLIAGIVNSGKTHLAHAIEEYCYGLKKDSGDPYKTCFVDYLDLIIECKRAISNKETDEWKVLEHYGWKDILIIDDFMVDTKTGEWVSELTYWLINNRYNFKKATIITTNHTLAELEEMFGFYGKRIVSRLQRMNAQKPIWIGQRRPTTIKEV